MRIEESAAHGSPGGRWSGRRRSSSLRVLVALIGAVGALRLEPDAEPDSLVDNGSSTYTATQDFDQQFGDDPVVVLVKGDLRKLLLTSDLGTAAGARGLPVGQGAGRPGVHGPAGAGAVRGDRGARPERCGVRAGDLPQPVRDPGAASSSSSRPRRRQRRREPAGRPRPRGRSGRVFDGRRSSRRRPAAGQAVVAAFQQQIAQARGQVRADRPAAPRRPELRQRRSIFDRGLPGTPEGALLAASSRAPTRR